MKTFKEYLNEGVSVKAGLQGALVVNGKSIAKIVKHGNNVFIMIDKEDGDKNRILVPSGKDMLTSEIVDWFESYLKKNPKALTENLEEAIDYTKKKHPDGGELSILINPMKNDGDDGKYTVVLRPSRKKGSIKTRKTINIQSFDNLQDAEKAKKEYAIKFGYDIVGSK